MKKNGEKRQRTLKSKLLFYLPVTGILLAIVVALNWDLFNYNNATSNKSNEVQKTNTYKSLDPSLVCMVNDAYMGKPQIPVPVNGKTYYGCCQGCVDKLNNEEAARTAIDPYSGKKVDKAEAYIVLTNQNGTVSYFESEDNYTAYGKKR